MKKELQKKLKKKLLQVKNEIKENLESFANKGEIKGDYKARFPEYGRGRDEEAQERSTFEARLPVEHEMEVDLIRVNKALQKIKEGRYGVCEDCGEEIEEQRLMVYPEAELCIECVRKVSASGSKQNP